MQLKILKSMLVWWFTVALIVHAQSAGPSFGHPRTKVQYGHLPLTFEANQGQLPPVVSFVSHAPGYSAYLTSEGMLLSLHSKSAMPEMADAPKGSSNHVTLSFQLRGAAKNPPATGEVKQPGFVNYFIGRDPSKWHTNVTTYAQVRYKNVYQGIDLVYYGDQRQLEYDFEVAPGADPRQIRFAIHGIRHLQVARDGNLLLDTAVGELRFQAPVLYQLSKGQRVAIRGRYNVNDDNTVSFRLDSYDPQQPLIIDPVLVYSSYLGGTGNEQVAGITVDANGNAYVVGSTDSPDFPLTTFGSTTTGNSQVFVAKIDATGSKLLFCDFLGGNSQDNGYGVALDAAHNVFVTGSTASDDFPLVNPFQGTYPGSYNGFLAKISSEGSSLMYSTYFGGNGSDVPVGVAVDTNGSAVIAGYTSSTSLPVSSAFQSSVSPNQGGFYGNYGFVAKFSPDGSSLVYSTYLGGSSNTPFNCGGTPCWPEPSSMVYGLALDVDGNTYVAGTTNTYNFPVTAGAFLSSDSTSMNGSIGFVSKFGNTGNLAYSTYFGDSLLTAITSVTVDANGSAYVSGLALDDGTFPLTSTNICDPTVYGSGCNFAFVSKFDPTGASLVYSTFLGPNNYAVPQAITLDRDNNAYVLAAAASGTFNTVNAIESFDGASDILLVEIDSTASTQLFATYLGGAGNDTPALSGMALDVQGSIYLAGTTDSSDFPVTQSAFQTTLAGNSDAFVAKIAAASGAAVALTPVTLAYANETVGTSSQPEDVLLRNMGSSWLSVSSVSVVGDFSETDTCAGGVPPAGSCTLAILFSPTVSGLRNGSVLITDDASGSPHSINLSGTGLGPSASLTPASVNFPSTPVGTSSQSELVTLANGGNADLTINSIQVSGDFSQTNDCLASLPAGSSCGINVTFTPSAVGARSGSLTIGDNSSGSPQTSALNGSGTALTPAASLTPANVTFPSVPVGTSSQSQLVTLANSGNADLTINNIQISGDFSQTNNCPPSLPAGSSCGINVTFTPSAVGARSGSLTISDNSSGSPQTSALNGSGTALTPAASLTPANVTFPSVPVGTSSQSQLVTLANSGNAGLTINNIQISGDFSQTNNCPPSLPAGSSCRIDVTFNPSAAGVRSGSLTIVDNAPGSPQVAAMNGAGGDFNLSSSIASSTINAGGTATYTVQIAPLAGSFSSPIAMSCSGAPSTTTCTLSSVSVTPGANSVSVIIKIATTAPSASAAAFLQSPNRAVYALWIQFQGLGLFGLILSGSKRRLRKSTVVLAVLLIASALLLMSGCAGGTGIGPQGHPGTPPGTYAISVSGSSGPLHHSLPLTLIVQ